MLVEHIQQVAVVQAGSATVCTQCTEQSVDCGVHFALAIVQELGLNPVDFPFKIAAMSSTFLCLSSDLEQPVEILQSIHDHSFWLSKTILALLR